MADLLAGFAGGVEQTGSSSVKGLLAKPMVDLAIGLTTVQELTPVRARLESAGWIYPKRFRRAGRPRVRA